MTRDRRHSLLSSEGNVGEPSLTSGLDDRVKTSSSPLGVDRSSTKLLSLSAIGGEDANWTERSSRVQGRILEWYRAQGRDLPWRHTHDPYAILVSEMMLQQTGVERVLPKYAEFLQLFPTLEALAAASTGAVIRAWAGLGYNSRAVRLQGIARQVIGEFGGNFPSTVAELRRLHGIGPYTAGAIACFAFNQQVAFLDTNVRRVLLRVFVGPDEQVLHERPTERTVQALAQGALPAGQAYDWHQALMDLGSQICTVYNPTCLLCPVGQLCSSFGRATAPSPIAPGNRVTVLSSTVPEKGRPEQVSAAPTPRTVHEDGPGWSIQIPENNHPPSPGTERSARRRPKEAPFVGSTRYYRGRIIAALRDVLPGDTLALDALGERVKPDYRLADREWLAGLVRQLEVAGLLVVIAPTADADKSTNLEAWQVSLP